MTAQRSRGISEVRRMWQSNQNCSGRAGKRGGCSPEQAGWEGQQQEQVVEEVNTVTTGDPGDWM